MSTEAQMKRSKLEVFDPILCGRYPNKDELAALAGVSRTTVFAQQP